MAVRYITCTSKWSNITEEYEIRGAGGTWGWQTKAAIHDDIKAQTHTYYTSAAGAPDALVYAAGSGESRYIQTFKDKSQKNNLINLPDCP